MIFISSSSIKSRNVRTIIETLAEKGIRNIELSGGTDWYNDLCSDLFVLKKQFSLNLLLHNYFPPPQKHFVLNLASCDDEIYNKTIKHYKESIALAIELGCSVYGLHAGFFINPMLNEMGRDLLVKHQFFDKEIAIKRFVEGFGFLKELFGTRIKLYVENNVLSGSNYSMYNESPLMLTCFDEYTKLKTVTDFNLLLDIGHLMVSANTLKLNFIDEVNNLINITNYIHYSSNNLRKDLHLVPEKDTYIYGLLKNNYTNNHCITLEVYDQDLDKTIDFYKEMERWI